MVDHIPPEMYRNGRGEDQKFDPNEDLYIRFKTLLGNLVAPNEIRCPNQSVNRSKYCSKPEYVLLSKYPKYLGWGYGSFKVSEIPEPKRLEGGGYYEFIIKHEPEEENYSHSEIKAYKDRNYNQSKTRFSSKHIVEYFQIKLSQQIKILKNPD